MGNWVRYPLPLFLSVSPLESMRSGGAIPPPLQKGYLSDTCAIPYENQANGCDTPLCDTIPKGYCAIWGVSRTGPLRAFRSRKILENIYRKHSKRPRKSPARRRPRKQKHEGKEADRVIIVQTEQNPSGINSDHLGVAGVPSDSKLLPTKNYSGIMISET